MTTMGIIELSVAKLRERGDPFKGCFWLGLDQPLTIEEVDAAIESGNLVPPTNPDDSWAAGIHPDLDCDREGHAGRIAWFVVHGWNDPLAVDVGVPSLGCCPAWLVGDGNHRFSAAIYRGDHTVRAIVDGDVKIIEQLLATQETE